MSWQVASRVKVKLLKEKNFFKVAGRHFYYISHMENKKKIIYCCLIQGTVKIKFQTFLCVYPNTFYIKWSK